MPLNLITLGRLQLPTLADTFAEGVSEPLDTTGAGVALGQRRPKNFALSLPLQSISLVPGEDLVAASNRIRRQLRSMLQNSTLRSYGIYLAYAVDPEINGWVMIGNGQIAYAPGNVMFGQFELTIDEIYKVASLRTHRPGLRFVVADRRLATTARDFLGQIFSVDFAGLVNLPLIGMPTGISDVVAASGRFPVGAFRQNRDGLSYLATSSLDGDAVGFEQAEASMHLGAVVAYDRKGTLTAPTTGPDAAWEEFYGSDWPYNWQRPGQPADAPLLDNGLCRVRYDGSGQPGVKIDVWTGTAWAEQGKVVTFRVDAGGNQIDDTWQSASLVEWSPERAVVSLVVRVIANGSSHEEVYITLQRGWLGPRIEVYPAVTTSGARADAIVEYTASVTATNQAIVKIDAGGAAYVATAGSGSTALPSVFVGSPGFSSENEIALIGDGRAYQVNAAAVTAATLVGLGGNSFYFESESAAGYVSMHLGFSTQNALQTMEAESIIYGSSTTASVVVDAAASGGHAVLDTQTSAANFTIDEGSPVGVPGAMYRVLARVRVATIGRTATFSARSLGNTATIQPSTSSTVFVWLDCGDLVLGSDGSFQGVLWSTAGGSGGIYVDRVELTKLEDRTTSLPLCDGARDLGQSALIDARAIPIQVER